MLTLLGAYCLFQLINVASAASDGPTKLTHLSLRVQSTPEHSHHAPDNKEIEKEDPVAAKHVAFCLLCTMVSAPLLFAMTQTSVQHVATYTYIAMDKVVTVFIAVLIYQLVDDTADAVLTSEYLHVNIHKHHALIFSIHAILWIPVTALVAWYLPKHGHHYDIFCALGAHVLSFFAIHGALKTQEHHFSSNIPLCWTGMALLLLLVVFFLVAACMSKWAILGAYPGSAELQEDEAIWVEHVDEIEEEVVAMAVATYLTMTLRFVILGRFSHFGGLKPGERALHSKWHRCLMLAYVCGMVVIAYFSIPFLRGLIESGHYIRKRIGSCTRAFLRNAIAWGFLLWGHWEIYERHFNWSPMFARLVFSSICSGMMCVIVWIYALAARERLRLFFVNTMAVIAGFTWHETINHSFDVVLEGAPKKYAWKVCAVSFVSAIVVPVWAIYLRPKIQRKRQTSKKNLDAQLAAS